MEAAPAPKRPQGHVGTLAFTLGGEASGRFWVQEGQGALDQLAETSQCLVFLMLANPPKKPVKNIKPALQVVQTSLRWGIRMAQLGP